jgi:hypothetical protein
LRSFFIPTGDPIVVPRSPWFFCLKPQHDFAGQSRYSRRAELLGALGDSSPPYQ